MPCAECVGEVARRLQSKCEDDPFSMPLEYWGGEAWWRAEKVNHSDPNGMAPSLICDRIKRII